jgi:dienelactone hydrolase
MSPRLVVPTELVRPRWTGEFDLYVPETDGPAPVVVLVHGLYQEPPEVEPRRSEFFRGYAAQLVQRGVAAVTFDHELTGGMRYQEAAKTLDRVLTDVRSRDDVDTERVGVWFFSGGGSLAYPVMAAAQPWLRTVALTYPLLPHEPIPDWPAQDDAVRGIGDVPVVFTRVTQELPYFVEGQEVFLSSGIPNLTLLNVDGPHGFDAGAPTDEGIAAVRRALDLVAAHVTGSERLRG